MSRKRQNNEKLPTVGKRKRNISENCEESESDDDTEYYEESESDDDTEYYEESESDDDTEYYEESESESDDDTEMVDDDESHRFNKNPIVNRSGKINKIILKNFMCHSNLIIEFNKNVNLLVGNNGSGKSAVLTALIVGLGSKSSATSRTNIAQLIKRGETSGSINIHIANNCDQGYDRETYGDEIIVQRTFTSDGSSTYRIKKSSGQVVSSSRKDLMKILLFMNIQVDNPVCVLNQEASIEFLKESDPKKRFKFFLKAAQIDTVIEKLSDYNSHYASAKKQLQYEKSVLVSLNQEVDQMQANFQSHQSIGFLKKALSNYKLELAWLKVENEETLRDEIKVTLNKYQQIYDDLVKQMTDRKQGEQGRKARCELLAAQINQLKEEIKGDLGLKEQIRKKISKYIEATNETTQQLLKIDKILQTNQKNVRQLGNALFELSYLLNKIHDFNGRLQKSKDQIDAEERSRVGLEEERSSLGEHIDEIDALIQAKRNEMAIIEENIQKKNDKIDEKQNEIFNENLEIANFSAIQLQVAKYKGQLETFQQKQQDCVHKLRNLTQVASNLADRIPIRNSENFLISKIKETEKLVGTVAEVEEALQLKSAEYSEKKELVENLERNIFMLKSSRQNRYLLSLRYKSHVFLRVQHEFNKIMKMHHYDGTLTIDHQKELLELSVTPRDQHIANSLSGTNCLSEGERSFSTVAFLLALWSVVDSPFYFLDECDVYTDAINRYYMTTLLLKEARKKKYRQYIFLTPQDMPDVTSSDDLSIHRLADPVRK